MTKKAMNDVTLHDGTHIPRGTLVGVLSYTMHHDDALYADADTFDPFRFARMAAVQRVLDPVVELRHLRAREFGQQAGLAPAGIDHAGLADARLLGDGVEGQAADAGAAGGVFTGKGGRDLFVFEEGDGQVTITDFASKTDKLVFVGLDKADVTTEAATSGPPGLSPRRACSCSTAIPWPTGRSSPCPWRTSPSRPGSPRTRSTASPRCC